MSAMKTALQILLVIAALLASQRAANAFPLSNGDQVQCEFSHGDKAGVATEIWNSYRKP